MTNTRDTASLDHDEFCEAQLAPLDFATSTASQIIKDVTERVARSAKVAAGVYPHTHPRLIMSQIYVGMARAAVLCAMREIYDTFMDAEHLIEMGVAPEAMDKVHRQGISAHNQVRAVISADMLHLTHENFVADVRKTRAEHASKTEV